MECSKCHKKFERADNLRRHELIHEIEKKFQCAHCSKKFHQKSNKQRHERVCPATKLPKSIAPPPVESAKSNSDSTTSKPASSFPQSDNSKYGDATYDPKKRFKCTHCPKRFHRKFAKQRHERICPRIKSQPSTTTSNENAPSSSDSTCLPGPSRKRPASGSKTQTSQRKYRIHHTATAFKGASVTWKLLCGKNDGSEVTETLESTTTAMKGKIERYSMNNMAAKFNMAIHVVFQQETDETIITQPPIVFVTEQFEVYSDNDLDAILKTCSNQLENRIAGYEGCGSGWTVKQILSMDTTVWKLCPLRGETYHELSKWIRNTKCVVNVKNTDNRCFRDAVMACLYTPTWNVSRVSSYTQFYDRDDAPTFESITFPMKLRDIAKFEKENEGKDITVHVYAVHEWCDRKGTKGKSPLSNSDISTNSISTMSDSEEESEPEESMTKDDRAFLDDQSIEETEVSMYRKMETDAIRKDMEAPTVASFKPKSHAEDEPDNMRGYIYPIRIAPQVGSRHVNLLLTEKDGVSHYSAIKNLDGFLRAQYTSGSHKHFHCYRCLHGFKAKKGEKTRDQCKNLQDHMKYCKTLTPQRVSYPKNEVAEFTNLRKMLKAPVVCYADFEATLQAVSDIDTTTGAQFEPPKKKKHAQYQQHNPASYFTKVVSIDPNFQLDQEQDFQFPQTETYVGKDCATHFLDYMTKVADKTYHRLFDNPSEMIFTPENKQDHEAATECHICQKRYSSLRTIVHAHRPEDDCSRCEMCIINAKVESKTFVLPIYHCHRENENEKTCSMCQNNKRIKVRDHCHVLHTYTGPAHQDCNLQYNMKKSTWKLPVLFHNLRSYDQHMLIRGLKPRHGKVRIIPTNMDKYLALQVGKLLFLDSMQFTLQGLETLVSTLNVEDFVHTRDFYGFGDDRTTWDHCHQEFDDIASCSWCIANIREEKFRYARQKGVFCYDYFDDIERLTEVELPKQDEFFNKLEDRKCAEHEYDHAKRVWEVFDMQRLKEYHDFYLKSDVLLLADFFEKFRKMCMEFYGLEPCHYFSAPGLAWDACLKVSGVKLELLDNEAMFSFVEHAIRGGISQISLRHAKANNPGMGSRYNPEEPLVHLMYLDANNLYGKAMSDPLPTGGFRWLTDEEIDTLDIQQLHTDDCRGFIFEVDLEIPHNLHDLHSDYPLAPERLEIDESMLSPFQKENFPEKQKSTTTKLAPNLRNKIKYVTHYRNLQFYLSQGLVLKKIHRVLTFTQSRWLEKYIDFNTRQRALAKNSFGKDFFKLLNNAVFGKTQENLRNRINVEVITDRRTALKRVCKPDMKHSYTIHEDLVIMETRIAKLKLNKPIYVGFTVLEISKLWMYEFHYDKMLKWFDNISLCFTDTDSLLYRIEGQDVYQVMKEHAEEFDFSEYPYSHFCYDSKNKKVLGKFKDELFSLTLEEFIGLRPKCYSLLFLGKVVDNIIVNLNIGEKQVAKGTKKTMKKRHLRHVHFKDVLENLIQVYIKQNNILSNKHSIGTYHQTKVSLTAYDTKRWILDDGVKTIAHGHYKTQ